MDLELKHHIEIVADEDELPEALLTHLEELGSKAASSQAAHKLREIILESLNKEISKLMADGRLKKVDGKWVFSSPKFQN